MVICMMYSASYDGHRWLASVDLLIMTSYAVDDLKTSGVSSIGASSMGVSSIGFDFGFGLAFRLGFITTGSDGSMLSISSLMVVISWASVFSSSTFSSTASFWATSTTFNF